MGAIAGLGAAFSEGAAGTKPAPQRPPKPPKPEPPEPPAA
jgi:hypothetical protein